MEQENIINRDNILKATGMVLKKAREEVNLSQTALSERSEVSKNTISNIEGGKKSPTLETLFRLFINLEMDIGKYMELVRLEYVHLEEIDKIYKHK